MEEEKQPAKCLSRIKTQNWLNILQRKKSAVKQAHCSEQYVVLEAIKQGDGTIRALSPRQVADLLGHSTSEITELYYVKKDTTRLAGITTGFEL